jgi:hypothetical protein
MMNDLGIIAHFQVYFQTTDWSGILEDHSGKNIGRGFPMLILRGTRYTGDILICKIGIPPTIDGDVDIAGGEWDDANFVISGELTVYVKMDVTYVYFGVTTTDNNENNGDACAIYFETDHANDGVNNTYDKRLRTYRVGVSWTDDWTIGTDTGWGIPQPLPANHIIAHYLEPAVGMEYEAQVPLATLNDAGQFDEDNERIGFAVIVLDGGNPHGEWPNGALDGDSTAWGELEIPEFQDILLPIFCVIFMVAIWQRRRKKMLNKLLCY